jgi:excisionase family DNA binding protein
MQVLEGLQDSDQVANFLKVPPRTLDSWAYRGLGPRFYRIGKHRRYRMEDVLEWVKEQQRGSSA